MLKIKILSNNYLFFFSGGIYYMIVLSFKLLFYKFVQFELNCLVFYYLIINKTNKTHVCWNSSV